MTTVIACSTTQLAELAVRALHDEADLTPKPGLVDRRGSGAHIDMDLPMLHASADALYPYLVECVRAATEFAIGLGLRAALGEIGRRGEARMLEVTGGVNTHRGALWALGLLCAGAALEGDAVTNAAQIARMPDLSMKPAAVPSHGELARRRYRVGGAVAEAQNGFPTVRGYGLPTLVAARAAGADEDTARLDALLALIAHLEDTCVLHRDGMDGLRAVQSAARRRSFTELDDLCLTRRISPGGSADLLAVTLLLDALSDRRPAACKR
jgi:triphosphoribosyl-dephospho-CoA synthase